MTVDRTIKISDLLTSLTILVSVITLTVSWSKDRLTREKEQADRVRSAAAKTLTQLDRWQALQLSIFRELQPVFVETSEMLVDNYKGRALPLAWRVRQSPKGHFPETLHIAIVELMREVIPEGAKVVFLGDGES
jgi:hypothetical protein